MTQEGPAEILAAILRLSVKVSERDEKSGPPNSPEPDHSRCEGTVNRRVVSLPAVRLPSAGEAAASWSKKNKKIYKEVKFLLIFLVHNPLKIPPLMILHPVLWFVYVFSSDVMLMEAIMLLNR